MKDLCDYMDSPPEERLADLQDLDENFDLDEDEQLEEEYKAHGISTDSDPFVGWIMDDDLPWGTDEVLGEDD